jgi:DNA invertase Pin-like site-specific DNA recombinase
MAEKTIGIYCRVSTDRQGTGLDAQRRSLLEYCQQKGIVNYSIFEDLGVSGSKNERKGLDALMRGVRDGSIQTVLVYSFSRFARSTRHLLDALAEFESLGVGFVSLTESIDTTSPIGKALFTIISAISQLERELVSERVKNGLKNAKASGKQVGKPKKRNSELIRSLREQGLSYRQIAKIAKCSLSSVHAELLCFEKSTL